MSRRYGRNQKRRARAEAAELHYLVELGSRETMHLNGEVRLLREALDIAREVLGPNHPAFEPSQLERFNADERLRMSIRQHPPSKPLSSPPDSRSTLRSWQYVDALTTQLVRDEYRAQTHFRFEFDSLVWGYGISEAALLTTPPSVTARNIAREITPLIMETLISKGRARRTN